MLLMSYSVSMIAVRFETQIYSLLEGIGIHFSLRRKCPSSQLTGNFGVRFLFIPSDEAVPLCWGIVSTLWVRQSESEQAYNE